MIFDFSDNDFIIPMGKDWGLSMNGNFHQRLSDHLSMDIATGNLCFTSLWDEDDDDEDDEDL